MLFTCWSHTEWDKEQSHSLPLEQYQLFLLPSILLLWHWSVLELLLWSHQCHLKGITNSVKLNKLNDIRTQNIQVNMWDCRNWLSSRVLLFLQKKKDMLVCHWLLLCFVFSLPSLPPPQVKIRPHKTNTCNNDKKKTFYWCRHTCKWKWKQQRHYPYKTQFTVPTWEQSQESLCSAIDDINFMESDSMNNFFSLLYLTLRTLDKLGLKQK